MKTIRLVAVPVLLAAIAGCAADPVAATAQPPPPAAVTTISVVAEEHAVLETLPGTVRAARAATLMARVTGVITRIGVTPGGQVAAGDVVVELDAPELAARRDQAAAVAGLGASDLARAQQLFGKQAMIAADYEIVRSRAAAAAATAAEAEIMVGYLRMRAPFAGVVVRRLAEVGELVSPGRAVIEVEDPASLRLEAEVPESLAVGIALGARLGVRIASAAIDQECAVDEITPAADPVSRTVLIKLALPGGSPLLRAGQFGRVALRVADVRAIAVPSDAIIQRGQLDAVFVAVDGRARLRLVRLGGREGGRTAIRSGLEVGDLVITAGTAGLRDGQAVTSR